MFTGKGWGGMALLAPPGSATGQSTGADLALGPMGPASDPGLAEGGAEETGNIMRRRWRPSFL